MAPSLKLTYFDVAGVAESSRWALEIGGLEWEDERLSQEDFMVLKPTLPNGQLPVLTVDGFMLPQSLTILRYVGKMAGLYPTDNLEAAKCDAIVDDSTDIINKLRPFLYEEDQEKKMAMRKELVEDDLPGWLGIISKNFEKTDGAYFCGDKLTIADLKIVSLLRLIKSMDILGPEVLESFSKLSGVMKTVTEEPKIAAFIAKHAK